MDNQEYITILSKKKLLDKSVEFLVENSLALQYELIARINESVDYANVSNLSFHIAKLQREALTLMCDSCQDELENNNILHDKMKENSVKVNELVLELEAKYKYIL